LDWYGLTRQKMIDHYGGGLLATVYRHSPLAALRDYAPGHDWKPWLMASTPQRYWRNPANRRRYMQWLGKQLGFVSTADWYELNRDHFFTYRGHGLLGNYYRGCVLTALREFMPHVQWKPWKFRCVPQGFWKARENRISYMDWLGKELKFKTPEDWYRVTPEDFERHRGATLLHGFAGKSAYRVLRDYVPDQDWHEWLFPRVPRGFWNKRANRRRFVLWLGEQLNYRRPADWSRLTAADVRKLGGGALLSMVYGNNIARMLRDCLERGEWDRDGKNKRSDLVH
jgi:hypothetical protein